MQPTVGRIVHYQSYGTPGGEYLPEPRAAIVTSVVDVPDQTLVEASSGVVTVTFIRDGISSTRKHDGGSVADLAARIGRSLLGYNNLRVVDLRTTYTDMLIRVLRENGHVFDTVDRAPVLDAVSLCVLNPTGLFFNENVPFSPEPKPGHWSWPPRA